MVGYTVPYTAPSTSLWVRGAMECQSLRIAARRLISRGELALARLLPLPMNTA
jgi:hypothetical protein